MADIPVPQGGPSAECFYHPGTGAVARCVCCGRLLCAYCRVVMANRNFCRSCLAAGGRPQAQRPCSPAGSYWPGKEYGYPAPPGFMPGDPYGRVCPPRVPAARYRKPREVVFPGAPWGVGEAMIIFVAAFVASSALSLGLYIALSSRVSAPADAILFIFFSSVLLYTLLLGGTFYSVKVRHKSTVTALGLKLDGLTRGFAWGVGLGLPLFLGAILLAWVSELLLRDTRAPDMVSRSVNKISSGEVGGGLMLLLFLALVVLAPVCEEIFFRGYLYPALRNRMDRQPAMLLNGLIFAAAHFEIIGFLPRFLLGYGLCYMYERQHNLAGPMVGHAVYNGLILLLAGVFQVF